MLPRNGQVSVNVEILVKSIKLTETLVSTCYLRIKQFNLLGYDNRGSRQHQYMASLYCGDRTCRIFFKKKKMMRKRFGANLIK